MRPYKYSCHVEKFSLIAFTAFKNSPELTSLPFRQDEYEQPDSQRTNSAANLARRSLTDSRNAPFPVRGKEPQ